MTELTSKRAWFKSYKKYGINPTISLPDGVTTLLDYFDYVIDKQRDFIAFTAVDASSANSLTFDELDKHSRALAAYLQSLGLPKGTKIAIMLPNILHYPIAMMATIRAGFVLVNINPLYTPRELTHQLNDADVMVLISAASFTQNINESLPKTAVKELIYTSDGLNFTHNNNTINTTASQYIRPAHITGDDVALLQYTGGTTGVAKGAMLTHQGLIINVYQQAAMFGNKFDGSNDHVLTALPLYHIFAFSVCVLFGMQAGLANLLIANPKDLPTLITAIKTYKPTMIPAVNTLFNAMLSNDEFKQMNHSHVKLSVGGGMAILEDTAKRWENIVGTPVMEGCGLSEAGTVVSVNPPAAGFTNSIGIPLPLTDIKLMDENNTPCQIGQAGEICIKGPQIMTAYYKREHEKDSYMTADGYFRTGDIGVMDDDGFIKIIDRKKDVVNVSGFNVYPTEIENVFTKHPDISECCAVGVPDEHSHEAVKLFAVSSNPSLTTAMLREWGRQYLTAYKLPKHIEFIHEIPKSAVGKILRKNLRQPT